MLTFRSLGLEGCRRLIEMAASEGWNPGVHDAETFFAVDPDAFLGLYEGERFAGGGAVVRHRGDYGFMGLFIVDREFRGRGLGRQLWFERRNRLLERLDPGATIGMDGVTAMVPFYQSGGFVPQYLSARYAGTVPFPEPTSPLVRDLAEFEPGLVEELDAEAFPGPRPAYLDAWLRQPGAVALGFGPSPDRLEGYGVLRPCREGYKVGPLFARTDEAARSLLLALGSHAEGSTLAIDVPTVNPAACGLAESLGFAKVFECTRMYHGPVPNARTERMFGLTTFELG